MNFVTGGPGLTKTRCAYQGLGCGKEDTCRRRGDAVMDCSLHTYMMFLDVYSDSITKGENE